MKNNYVVEEVYLYDFDFFKDKAEHCYNLLCYDGYAIGELYDIEDTLAPKKIKLTYPKRKVVMRNDEMIEHILSYRGLYDVQASEIHFGDIAIVYGKIEK